MSQIKPKIESKIETKFLTAALYKFVSLPEYTALQASIQAACVAHHIKGTILLAAEGMNGTIAGLPENIHKVLHFLRTDAAFEGKFSNLEHKESYADDFFFQLYLHAVKRVIVSV